MLINSLETMEKIVENNKTLSWDGWNVKVVDGILQFTGGLTGRLDPANQVEVDGAIFLDGFFVWNNGFRQAVQENRDRIANMQPGYRRVAGIIGRRWSHNGGVVGAGAACKEEREQRQDQQQAVGNKPKLI